MRRTPFKKTIVNFFTKSSVSVKSLIYSDLGGPDVHQLPFVRGDPRGNGREDKTSLLIIFNYPAPVTPPKVFSETLIFFTQRKQRGAITCNTPTSLGPDFVKIQLLEINKKTGKNKSQLKILSYVTVFTFG